MKYLIFVLMMALPWLAGAANPILCDEITNDPLARGYSGMDAEAIVVDINTEYRSRWKDCVDGRELLDAVESADWNAITDAQRDRTLMLLGIGCLDPTGNARTMMIRIYGSGSDTIANMAAVGQEAISRAEELGLPRVRTGEVLECQ